MILLSLSLSLSLDRSSNYTTRNLFEDLIKLKTCLMILIFSSYVKSSDPQVSRFKSLGSIDRKGRREEEYNDGNCITRYPVCHTNDHHFRI